MIATEHNAYNCPNGCLHCAALHFAALPAIDITVANHLCVCEAVLQHCNGG